MVIRNLTAIENGSIITIATFDTNLNLIYDKSKDKQNEQFNRFSSRVIITNPTKDELFDISESQRMSKSEGEYKQWIKNYVVIV